MSITTQDKIEEEKKRRLREKMIKGYKANATEDAAMSEAWRFLQEEAASLIGVQKLKKSYGGSQAALPKRDWGKSSARILKRP